MEIKYQNGQICNECALVTVWNAARFWGIHPVPRFGSQNYKKICRLLGGFGEGCHEKDLSKEMKRLGLKKRRGYFDIKWIKDNLPVEFSIKTGYGDNQCLHSTLAVEVNGQRIRLLNYENSTRERWIYWQQIKTMSGYYDGWIPYYPYSIQKATVLNRPVLTIKEMYG